MKLNTKALTKGLAMALATICISLPFANTSEAAHRDNPPSAHHRAEAQKSDVHYVKHDAPKHHKICKNPYHSRMSKHFHCSKASHHHDLNPCNHRDHDHNKNSCPANRR